MINLSKNLARSNVTILNREKVLMQLKNYLQTTKNKKMKLQLQNNIVLQGRHYKLNKI